MSYLRFHPVSATHGFAVQKIRDEYVVAFLRKERGENGMETFIREGIARSNGKPHSYSSPFIADHAIRTQILPLYKRN